MSQITIVNDTPDVPRIAIYKKPVLQSTLETVAWRIIAAPPNGGQTIVDLPNSYSVYANYSFDPAERGDPRAGHRTNAIKFGENTARFMVQSVPTQDRRVTAATLSQTFDDLVLNEVRVENHFGHGVWTHVTAGGDCIYAPQVLWPGAVRIEDVRTSLYVAVVSQFVFKGARLVDEEISLTEVEILAGGVATVTGSLWDGYAIG